jgi:flagellar biosynthesis protein FlhF
LARRLARAVHDELNGQELKEAPLVRKRLAAEIESRVRVTGELTTLKTRAKKIALIGPTGVGKTTTIAKLAARFAVIEKCSVALVTIDTFRIAAADQLRTYAEIIDVPLEVVMTPQEFRQALDKHHQADFIFIDTVGGSQFNEAHLRNLRTFLATGKPHETHLVISAPTELHHILKIVERFGLVPINALLVSKLDETAEPGSILNILAQVDMPLSYLTTGQNVPDDIEVATQRRVTDLLLGEEGSES